MSEFSFQLPSTSFTAPSYDFNFSAPSFSFDVPSFDFSAPSISLPTFETPTFDFSTPSYDIPTFTAPELIQTPTLEPFTEYQPVPEIPVFEPIAISNPLPVTPEISVAPVPVEATTPSMATSFIDTGEGSVAAFSPSFEFKLPETSFQLPESNYFAESMFQIPDFSSSLQTYDFGAIASGNYDLSMPQIPEIKAPSISDMYAGTNFSFTTPMTDAIIADLGDTNSYLENYNFNFNTPPLSPETIAAIEQDASYEAAAMAAKTFNQPVASILAGVGLNEISAPSISQATTGTGYFSISAPNSLVDSFLKPSTAPTLASSVISSAASQYRPATQPATGTTASKSSGSGGLDSLLKGLTGLGNALSGLLTGRGGGGGSSGGGGGGTAGAGGAGTAGAGAGTPPGAGQPGGTQPGGTQVAQAEGAKWPWLLFGLGALYVLTEDEKKGKGSGGSDSLASVTM